MPSEVGDILKPYVAGELQWPLQQDASVCRIFRGLRAVETAQNPLPPVATGPGRGRSFTR
jgi:hypothetical protein